MVKLMKICLKYYNFRQAHNNRYAHILPTAFSPSITPIEDDVGRGIIEGSNGRISKEQKNDIRKGLADMMGTRIASTAPN